VQEQKIVSPIHMPDPRLWQVAAPAAANPDTLTRAGELLLNAKLPLVVGDGLALTRPARQVLVDLVELTGAAYQDDLAMVGFRQITRRISAATARW